MAPKRKANLSTVSRKSKRSRAIRLVETSKQRQARLADASRRATAARFAAENKRQAQLRYARLVARQYRRERTSKVIKECPSECVLGRILPMQKHHFGGPHKLFVKESNVKECGPSKNAPVAQNYPRISYANFCNFLSVRFSLEHPSHISSYENDCISLGAKLKEEGFLSEPVKWLVRKGFIKSLSPCYVCNGPSRLKANNKFTDGCSQVCLSPVCQFENQFRRPPFFAPFDFSLSNLLAIIFHWVAQSDPEVIMSVIHLPIDEILYVRSTIQDICASMVKDRCTKLGRTGEFVEVLCTKYDNLSILGAYERNTRTSFLDAFSSTQFEQFETCQLLLNSWIVKEARVVVSSIELYMAVKNLFKATVSDTEGTNNSDEGYHVQNIADYFQKNILPMFWQLDSKFITVKVVKKYLFELMWRERFGRIPETALFHIMKEVASYDIEGLSNERMPKNTKSAAIYSINEQARQGCLNYYNGIERTLASVLPVQHCHASSSTISNADYEEECSEKCLPHDIQAQEVFIKTENTE